MSNNARVVAGGEIGVAQYLQARAAGIEPDVRMNPVLVEPEGDDKSQVVVNGVADLALSRRRWRERASVLWPAIEESLRSLLAEFELVLIEGAGSPAEINLRDCAWGALIRSSCKSRRLSTGPSLCTPRARSGCRAA